MRSDFGSNSERQRLRQSRANRLISDRLSQFASIAARGARCPQAFVSVGSKPVVAHSYGLGPESQEGLSSFAALVWELGAHAWIEDALVHPQLCEHPWISSRVGIRFVASSAIWSTEPGQVGTLVVLDTKPRNSDAELARFLEDVSSLASNDCVLASGVGAKLDPDYCERRAGSCLEHFLDNGHATAIQLEESGEGSLTVPFISGTCEEFLGIKAPDIVSDPALLLNSIHPEDRESFDRTRKTSAASLQPWNWEGRCETPFGAVEWIRLAARPSSTEGGVRWQGVVVSVTQYRLSELAYRNAYHYLDVSIGDRREALRASQAEMLLRLGRAAEYRDGDTGAHIARMSNYCAVIAKGAGVSPEDCELILLASTMHDIGKIGVPDAVLLKEGELEGCELGQMRNHVTIGSELLKDGSSDLLKTAEIIARTHHEKWDGTGYPAGLAGAQIHLFGRIAAIADVFDALTTERPYKKAWSIDDAVAHIVSKRGTHFDPDLVDVFVKVLPEIVAARARFDDGDNSAPLLAA